MSEPEGHSASSNPWKPLFLVCGIIMIYLLGTGPMTRWFPSAADKIYFPLAPLMKHKTLSEPMRKYLSLWGVK